MVLEYWLRIWIDLRGETMAEFRKRRELRKADFECRAISIDNDVNRFWADLENPNVKPSTLKRHIMRIGKLLEDYKELQLCGIDVMPIDIGYLESLCGLLFDKYVDMI